MSKIDYDTADGNRWDYGVVDADADGAPGDDSYAGRVVINWGQFSNASDHYAMSPITTVVTDYDIGVTYNATRKLVIADCDRPVVTVDLTMLIKTDGSPIINPTDQMAIGENGQPEERTWRFMVKDMRPLFFLDPTANCSCSVISGGTVIHHPWCNQFKKQERSHGNEHDTEDPRA